MVFRIFPRDEVLYFIIVDMNWGGAHVQWVISMDITSSYLGDRPDAKG